MTVNHGVLGSSPCSGAIARGLQERCRSGVDSTSVERKILVVPSHFREFSSAGSEHLPYKQRVGGSNPSTPTQEAIDYSIAFFVTPLSESKISPLHTYKQIL